MSPRLYPWHVAINDTTTGNIPRLTVGYGYGVANEDDPQQPNELPAIFDFVQTTLTAP